MTASLNDAGDFSAALQTARRWDRRSKAGHTPPGSRHRPPTLIDRPRVLVTPRSVDGHNLTYVWKYRNRWFFIEGGTHERLVSAAQCGRRRAAA